MSGTLYLVSTPIGNLSDLSRRAVDTLSSVDFIAAEDTRVTRKLTGHLGIKKPLISYRKHNQIQAGEQILARILAGENCALVSDAGTPSISDPGRDITALCIDNDIPVEVIPGPCAAISALVLSGFPTGSFVFEGFLPVKQSRRVTHLESLKSETRTLIFYEAPHKLVRTLLDMVKVFGTGRRVSISREMTKLHEQTVRMTLGEAAVYFCGHTPRGEFVIVLEGARDTDISVSADELSAAVDAAVGLIDDGLSLRDAVKKAACDSGCSKNDIYDAVVKLR